MIDEEIRQKFRKLIAEAFDYDAVLKEHNITQDDVDNFRELLRSSEHCPKALMDKALILTLAATNNRMDKSINITQNYCKLVRETPEFFANRDVESEEIHQAMDNQYFITLPPTPDNCNVIYFKLQNSEPKNYIFDSAEKTFLMTVAACIYNNGPRNGVIFLFDMKNCRVGHVFQPSMTSLRKLLKIVQDGCPFRIRKIHILNTVPFLDLVMALIKPFMRSYLLQRVVFHPPTLDFEKFYQECIPKSCLPSDYGGDLASVDELHSENRKALLKMRDFFLMEERMMNFEFEGYDFDRDEEDKTVATKM